jgi:hypothetical protein
MSAIGHLRLHLDARGPLPQTEAGGAGWYESDDSESRYG